jgi:hypothetical protein
VLQQQPLLVGRRAHQRIRALQLLAAQKDAQLALRELLSHPRLGFFAIAEGVTLTFVG